MAANLFEIDTSPESPELLAIAEKELRETPENRANGLRELRELLKKNSDLNFSDDEEFLVIILRVCHWYPESAIEHLRDIAKFRKEYAKSVKDLMPVQEKIPFTESGLLNSFTHRDHKNRRIVVIKSGGAWNPDTVSEESIFRMFYLSKFTSCASFSHH
jgi:retinaldehyde-binding protein 1